MPLQPEHIDSYIAQYGPYLYHGIANRQREDINQLVARIMHEGLHPNQGTAQSDRPVPPWGDGVEDPTNPEHADWWYTVHDEWWLTPRANHVFLVQDANQAYGPPVLKIDIRELDAAKFKADDDDLRDHGISFKRFPHRLGDDRLTKIGHLTSERWMPDNEHTLGEQAEMIGWGEHIEETLFSLFECDGIIAYQGSIPAIALEIHDRGPDLTWVERPQLETEPNMPTIRSSLLGQVDHA